MITNAFNRYNNGLKSKFTPRLIIYLTEKFIITESAINIVIHLRISSKSAWLMFE